jgi:hypothetical protein
VSGAVGTGSTVATVLVTPSSFTGSSLLSEHPGVNKATAQTIALKPATCFILIDNLPNNPIAIVYPKNAQSSQVILKCGESLGDLRTPGRPDVKQLLGIN